MTSSLKTEMVAEEPQHVILKTIGYVARVSSLVLFKAIGDSILIKHLMQFGCVHSQTILITNVESDSPILT